MEFIFKNELKALDFVGWAAYNGIACSQRGRSVKVDSERGQKQARDMGGEAL